MDVHRSHDALQMVEAPWRGAPTCQPSQPQSFHKVGNCCRILCTTTNSRLPLPRRYIRKTNMLVEDLRCGPDCVPCIGVRQIQVSYPHPALTQPCSHLTDVCELGRLSSVLTDRECPVGFVKRVLTPIFRSVRRKDTKAFPRTPLVRLGHPNTSGRLYR